MQYLSGSTLVPFAGYTRSNTMFFVYIRVFYLQSMVYVTLVCHFLRHFRCQRRGHDPGLRWRQRFKFVLGCTRSSWIWDPDPTFHLSTAPLPDFPTNGLNFHIIIPNFNKSFCLRSTSSAIEALLRKIAWNRKLTFEVPQRETEVVQLYL